MSVGKHRCSLVLLSREYSREYFAPFLEYLSSLVFFSILSVYATIQQGDYVLFS